MYDSLKNYVYENLKNGNYYQSKRVTFLEQ